MTPAPSASSRVEHWLPWIAGTLALLPLAWCYRAFSDLWWFGDDWELLDQIACVGFWHWTMQVFAENFVPLFKVLWGGMVYLGRGSYFPMIAALWLTHAFNVALLARLLRRTGFALPGTVLMLALFAFPAMNLETLAWSVQWSAILAVTFLLLAVDWHVRRRPEQQAWNWRVHGVLVLLIGASALSFSRGVLTGATLGTMCLLAIDERVGQLRWRAQTAAICLLPPCIVTAVIFHVARGNHHQIAASGGHWLGAAVEFGAWYWAVSPLHRLIEPDSWGGHTTLILGMLKLAVVIAGMRLSHGIQRRMLVLFLLLDVGNAALLGIGRYHTGLTSTTGLRYQYAALLSTLPFIAVCFDACLAHLPRLAWRAIVTAVVVGWLTFKLTHTWPAEVDQFADWRGRNTRALLLRNPRPPADEPIPWVPFLSVTRGKELVVHFGLH